MKPDPTIDNTPVGGRGESLSSQFLIYRFDMVSFLPDSWEESVTRCLAQHGLDHSLGGESSTSREQATWASTTDTVPARALVADGRAVLSDTPWLDALYRGQFLGAANGLGEERYVCARDLPSGVNINAIPAGCRYEWHVDSNPLTGVLFLSGDHDGGDLLFRPDHHAEDWTVRVKPQIGHLLLFDAREVPHTVEPVLGGNHRISVPMNYYLRGEIQTRPSDLDLYLYGERPQ